MGALFTGALVGTLPMGTGARGALVVTLLTGPAPGGIIFGSGFCGGARGIRTGDGLAAGRDKGLEIGPCVGVDAPRALEWETVEPLSMEQQAVRSRAKAARVGRVFGSALQFETKSEILWSAASDDWNYYRRYYPRAMETAAAVWRGLRATYLCHSTLVRI
jgi:hypothetical protein